MASGRRSTGSSTAPALYKSTKAINYRWTEWSLRLCICTFRTWTISKGTGFKSAAKSKEVKVARVAAHQKGFKVVKITSSLRDGKKKSPLLLSKSANRAAGEPRYSISQCFTLCDVESQLLRHLCSVQKGPLKRNTQSQYRFSSSIDHHKKRIPVLKGKSENHRKPLEIWMVW